MSSNGGVATVRTVSERPVVTLLSGPAAGVLGGRLFFNVAGVGFDAHLAAAFNAGPRRGLGGYVKVVLREVATYVPARYRVTAGDVASEREALFVAVANTRQYGSHALIAPRARPDDGLLELVVVPALSVPAILWQAPRLFTGTLQRLKGVQTCSVSAGAIAAAAPLAFHVDGEVVSGSQSLTVGVSERALAVRVPG